MTTLVPRDKTWLQRFVPEPLRVSKRERLRACVGALLGIGITGLIATWLFGVSPAVPLLVAPMGASAVLLFAAPASPLAQPWSIIGGNLVAACVGVASAHWISNPILAAAIAVAASIGIMFALRCLHPPSGAIALTAVLGGPSIHALGYGFILNPVLLNSVLILGCALLYHGVTRHRYPHSPLASPATPAQPAASRLGFTREDLEAALADNDQLLTVSIDDLQSVLENVESHTYHRKLRQMTCADIMAGNVRTLLAHTTLAHAWKKMNRYHVRAFPVVDNQQHLLGILTRDDVMQRARLAPARRLLPIPGAQQTTINFPVNASIARLMNADVHYVHTDTSVAELITRFTQTGHHHLPVVNNSQRVVGMVTPADLVKALHTEHLQA